MNEKRRMVLKGMALGGFASMGAGLSHTVMAAGASATGKPLFVLVNESLSKSAFIKGVAAASKAPVKTVMANKSLEFVKALQAHLAASNGVRMVGLTDDASAALIIDLARSAGARINWIGQHAVGLKQSIHSLSTVDSTRHCTVELARNLQQCGQAFTLNEAYGHAPSGLSLTLSGNGQAVTQQWMANLGYSLVAPNRMDAAVALPKNINSVSPESGHFVSFSIEI